MPCFFVFPILLSGKDKWACVTDQLFTPNNLHPCHPPCGRAFTFWVTTIKHVIYGKHNILLSGRWDWCQQRGESRVASCPSKPNAEKHKGQTAILHIIRKIHYLLVLKAHDSRKLSYGLLIFVGNVVLKTCLLLLWSTLTFSGWFREKTRISRGILRNNSANSPKKVAVGFIILSMSVDWEPLTFS